LNYFFEDLVFFTGPFFMQRWKKSDAEAFLVMQIDKLNPYIDEPFFEGLTFFALRSHL